MNSDEIYRLKRERIAKESVYEQWRKYLCIFVVDEDVNVNSVIPRYISTEKVRTVFNNGYKFAMMQTLESISQLSLSSDPQLNEVLELLASQIQDRITTSKCLESYSRKEDQSFLFQELAHDKQFDASSKESYLSWSSTSTM
jgi:hypothetical protein